MTLETITYITLGLMAVSFGIGFLIGKLGLSGIEADISNIKTDIQNLKTPIVVTPVVSTPVVATV